MKNCVIVNGKEKSIWDVTYDELVVLYREYIEKSGKVPTTLECKLANNLPHMKVIKKTLSKSGITYNSFLAQFGKYSHVRTECVDNYDMYVTRFKEVCNEIGRTLTTTDLMNNEYGLPSSKWLVDNCPDKTVKNHIDFVRWCGYKEAKHVWTKEEVAEVLIAYEKQMGRPLIQQDIAFEKTGFSSIVVDRLYGTFSKAKQEIGLMKTPPAQPKPFEYYKNALTTVINNYREKTGLSYITWRDIESGEYGYEIEHKSYTKSFKSQGIDMYAYILSLGCMMNKQMYSHAFTFPTGERVASNYEKSVTMYLQDLGLKYNVDYRRSVKYKTFTDITTKIDCDYVIDLPNGKLYIEVAGIIHNPLDGWRTHKYNSPAQTVYRDKMLMKEDLLVKNNLPYLFIFPKDIELGKYKCMIDDALKKLEQKVA